MVASGKKSMKCAQNKIHKKVSDEGIQVQPKFILILNPICDKFWFVGGEKFPEAASH